MIEFLFYLCLLLIIYIYVGYPLCILILSKLMERPVAKDKHTPTVSILIAAYNEESHIAETIENKLAQDYPHHLLEIIVVSDGSTDGTDGIIKKYINRGVKLLRQKPRQGKTSALNMAVREASGEILVFSDANSIYKNDALKQLIANFNDPSVGYVTGNMVYVYSDGGLIGSGCSAYMTYENTIRSYESRFNSIVGVDGGIDAVRKSLYVPMKPDQLPDFVLPLRVVEQSYRVIYEPSALLKEEALSDEQSEYRMRTRVSLRSLWALWYLRALFNPLRHPIYSWQLLSHKLLRYLAWIPLCLLFVLNILLIEYSHIYIWTLILQVMFYTFSFCGYLLKQRKNVPIILYGPYYFVLVNLASAHAFLQFTQGKRQTLWTPRTG